MRDLIVTENITLDGVVEATEGWFDPAGGGAEVDQSDVQAALREQSEAAPEAAPRGGPAFSLRHRAPALPVTLSAAAATGTRSRALRRLLPSVRMREVLRHLFDEKGPFLTLMASGLAGLTDEEYLWEPVDDCWSVRSRSTARTPPPPWMPSSEYVLEISYPDPDPSPFTTIAWRMVHMTGSVDVATATLQGRHRPDGAIDGAWSDGAVPLRAADAVGRWQVALTRLRAQLEVSTDADLVREERQWWDEPNHVAPVWEQVIYFAYFEPASHGAEVRLIRDLFRHTQGGAAALHKSPRLA